MHRTARLDLPLLLPDVKDQRDACVARLVRLLARRDGLESVHVVDAGEAPDGEPPHFNGSIPVAPFGPQLCLHYDTDRLSLSQVEALAPARVAATLAELKALEGDYDAGRGVVIRAFVHEGGLFLSHPRLGDKELVKARDREGLYYGVGGRITATFAEETPAVMVLTVVTPEARIVAKRTARP